MATFKITGPVTDLERKYLVAMDSMVLDYHRPLAVFYVVHGAVSKEDYTVEDVFQETWRVFTLLRDRGLATYDRRGMYALTPKGKNFAAGVC